MQTVVIVLHLMIVAAMIGVVLLQKSEGGGLGMGGGAGFMSSRGTANLLTRTTAVLAVGFFLTSLFLSWLAGYDRKPTSIIPTSTTQQPAAPISPSGGGGLLDTLRKADEQSSPAAPASGVPAPTAPAVPGAPAAPTASSPAAPTATSPAPAAPTPSAPVPAPAAPAPSAPSPSSSAPEAPQSK